MTASRPHKLFIVLPSYNEEAALRQLIPDLDQALKSLGLPFAIVVVDDASTDGTPALLQSFAPRIPVQHLRHEKNMNYGAAIKTGALWVLQQAQPEDALVVMDADNTHSPAYIKDLIKKLQEGYAIVTASYTKPGAASRGVPFMRRIYSRAANGLLRLRFHFPGIRTYTNGYRIYRVDALQRVEHRYGNKLIESTNFAGGTELFVKAVRCGGRAGEIPFTLDYDKRGKASKINIPQTVLSYLQILFR